MNQPLAPNSNRPLNAQKQMLILNQDPVEHPALNWTKLIFLVLMTYGLMVSMWFICLAIEHMHNDSIPESFEDAGGLLFGLFCFYVLCFGGAWYWGSGQRQEMRTKAVEQQIARQKANEIAMQLQ